MDWPLQDATKRLAEVVRRAHGEGPQALTIRGKRVAVVVSAEEFDTLWTERPTLVDTLLAGPVWEDELVAAVSHRAKTASRDPAF